MPEQPSTPSYWTASITLPHLTSTSSPSGPRGISGPGCDVGCGAGQWTQLLTDLGCEAEGIDPVPEFIDIAQDTHPDVTYRVGRAESLGVPEEALDGVLAR